MFSSIDEAWNNNFIKNLSFNKKTIESFTPGNSITNMPSANPSTCPCEDLIKKILSCSDCTDKIKFILSKQSSPLDKYILNPINSMSKETKDNIILGLFIFAFFIIIYIIYDI